MVTEDEPMGLCGPRAELDSCGVGFVASRTGVGSSAILREALRALRCAEHREACGADQVAGDGTGVMTDIPFELFEESTCRSTGRIVLSRER